MTKITCELLSFQKYPVSTDFSRRVIVGGILHFDKCHSPIIFQDNDFLEL